MTVRFQIAVNKARASDLTNRRYRRLLIVGFMDELKKNPERANMVGKGSGLETLLLVPCCMNP